MALTSSFGSCAKGALVCPLASVLRAALPLYEDEDASSIHVQTAVAAAAAQPTRIARLALACASLRELAFVHVAQHHKALSSAACDVHRLAKESGVAELRREDRVAPALKGGLVLSAATAALLCHGSSRGACGTAPDFFTTLLCNALLGALSAALALEPLLAATDVVHLSFADNPAGLDKADPIVYRRFIRILHHDQLAATPPPTHPTQQDEVEL